MIGHTLASSPPYVPVCDIIIRIFMRVVAGIILTSRFGLGVANAFWLWFIKGATKHTMTASKNELGLDANTHAH